MAQTTLGLTDLTKATPSEKDLVRQHAQNHCSQKAALDLKLRGGGGSQTISNLVAQRRGANEHARAEMARCVAFTVLDRLLPLQVRHRDVIVTSAV